MKNQHLVPVNILDIYEKLSDPRIKENEKANYILRLETIRDYCDAAVKKANTTVDRNTKSKLNYSRIGRNNI